MIPWCSKWSSALSDPLSGALSDPLIGLGRCEFAIASLSMLGAADHTSMAKANQDLVVGLCPGPGLDQ